MTKKKVEEKKNTVYLYRRQSLYRNTDCIWSIIYYNIHTVYKIDDVKKGGFNKKIPKQMYYISAIFLSINYTRYYSLTVHSEHSVRSVHSAHVYKIHTRV